MNRNELHALFMEHEKKINGWFESKSESAKFPIYGSFDLRESSFKTAPVDANIYPAGFNNICEVDRDNAPTIFKRYFDSHYQGGVQRILLLSEVNSKNLFYWDNVHTLKTLIENAGFEVCVAIPDVEDFPSEITSAAGSTLKVSKVKRVGGGVEVCSGFVPDIIVSNNDFSNEFHSLVDDLTVPINPPYQLGWHKRKKDRHFFHYNNLAAELASELSVDPWWFQIQTEKFSNFDMNDDGNRNQLAETVQRMIDGLKRKYKEENISEEPVIFVKSNSGTYGMGVTQVKSGADIVNWNNKSRKKMKMGKGGVPILELIVQEGIPSAVKDSDGSVAEPVIYMVGCDLVGGFLRTHKGKGVGENLNSPGAVFKRLCISDLQIDRDGSPLENVYGTFASLAQIAISREAEEMGAPFPNYT